MMEKIIFRIENNKRKVFNVKDILYFKSEGHYVWVHLKDNNRTLLCNLCKDIEFKLNSSTFFRINKQCIINFEHLEEYQTTKGTLKISMSDGTNFNISRGKLKKFKNALKDYFY
jgi:DNA-binding LytR/AlgR family response regulator